MRWFQVIGYLNYLIDATYKESGNKCRMTFAHDSTFVPIFYSLNLAKNGPYTQGINDV